ncbi:MAG: nucleotidyltransferase family protein, partial [Desulfovibrio sp.]|uniref:nucleotidyltransferase family protein n=1 Tax=Desulfovibrio sp. TaxID=885 RepID=UPI00258E759A
MNHTPVLRHLVTKLYAKYVSKDDKIVLNLVFAKNPTQDMLDHCLSVCDIEALEAGKCLLLSYFIHEHNELILSDYAGPRIKGLITYFRFANMKPLAHFSKIGKAFNKAGIPMLLFKGGAMKVLRPALPRPMGDIDVLIPADRIEEATRIGENLGYFHYKEESAHAVDFHTETESAVDVHHAIFDPGRDLSRLHRNLFARATPRKAFGVEFLLPCHEDLCFLVMANFTKNLREHTSLGNLYYALCDCRFLREKEGFDWKIVREDAAVGGRELEVRFAAEFMNAIVAGTIPDIDCNLPADPGMEAFCNQMIFDEDYYLPRRKKCQAIRVVELKNAPWKLGSFIAGFLLMKKLRK